MSEWPSNISRAEQESARVVTSEGTMPEEYEGGVREALRKRALIKERAFTVRHAATHPRIAYPEQCPIEHWENLVDVVDKEADPSTVERVRVARAHDLQAAYEHVQDPMQKRQMDYLFAQLQESGVRLSTYASWERQNHERSPLHLLQPEQGALDETTLFLYGRLLDGGVRCEFRPGELAFVRNAPMFTHMLEVLGERLRDRSLFFELKYVYEAMEIFGDEYVEDVARALDAYDVMRMDSAYLACIEPTRRDDSLLSFISQEPYLIRSLAKCDPGDMSATTGYIQSLQAISGRSDWKNTLKVNEFVYLTELYTTHGHLLPSPDELPAYLTANNLLDATPSEILLYSAHAREKLPLTEKDRSHWVTKEMVARAYAQEQLPELEALATRFGIEASTVPVGHLQDDVPGVVQRKVWALRYLGEHPEMQEAVSLAFKVTSFDQLADVVETVLRERVDTGFQARMRAAERTYRAIEGDAYQGIRGTELLRWGDKYDAKFIEWLGEVHRKTGIDSIQEVREGHNGGEGTMFAWCEWYKDPHMFARACAYDVFQDKDRRPSHETFTAVVSNEALMGFIEQHPTYNFLDRCLQGHDSARLLEPWTRNGLFEKVEGLGLFAGKQSSEVWMMITRYSEYAPLMKLDTEEVSRGREILQALRDDCGMGDLGLHQNFPADFIVEALRDQRLLDIVRASQPLSQVQFDAKYHGGYFLQDKLVWTTHIDPALRDDFLEYLKQGNIVEGISGDFSQKNFAFLPESHKAGQEVKEDHLERAWWRETAPWRERRRLIDFLESTHMRLCSKDELQLLATLAKQYDMRDVAKLYTVLSGSVGSVASNPAELATFVPYVKHFGLAQMPVVYQYARTLLSSNQTEPLMIEGLTLEPGEAGMRRMKEFVQSSATKLVEQDAELRFAETSPIAEDTFRYLLRFDTSVWARPGTDFAGAWKRLDMAVARGTAGNIPRGYGREEVVLQSIPHDLDLGMYREKYCSVTSMLSQGLHSTTFPNTRAMLIEAVRKDIEQKSARIAQEGVVGPNTANSRAEKIVTALTAQRRVAENLLGCFENAKTSEDILGGIASARYSIPAFEALLPPLMFRDVFDVHPKWQDHIEPFLQQEEPTVEAMRTLEEFMRIQVKEHALGLSGERGNTDIIYPHLSEKQRKFVQQYVPVKRFAGLEELVSATQSAPLKKKFLFVPSRGLMGEMSGYLADACWTRQQNIIESNQNMVPVVCVEGGGVPILRGSFLLFESTVNAGSDKVLVVRGVNPQDGLLAQATAGSFCDEVLRYAEGVAMARGIRYVVADTGASIASNRPGIYTHLAQQYPLTERESGSRDYAVGNQVHLDQVLDFNGYNITDSCRVLKEVSAHAVTSDEHVAYGVPGNYRDAGEQ